MKDKILILGGYGQVGRYVSMELMDVFPEKVFAGGRNMEKAISFSKETNGRVKPFHIDIYDTESFCKVLTDIALVIMCLSPKKIDFAKYCIENQIHYIDISPSNTLTSEIKSLENTVAETKSTCILGVGLAPGLSNLMVKKAKPCFDEIKSVDIFLMLGLGERHGIDGIKWLLDNINTEFLLKREHSIDVIKTFRNKKKTKFPKQLKIRTAYSFDLADQHTIPITLGLNNVSSYFCYDSSFVTKGVAILKNIGLFELLRFGFIYNLFVSIFNQLLNIIIRLKLCSDVYSIKLEIEGIKDNGKAKHLSSIIGNNNSSVTGKVAAIVAKQIYEGKLKHGIFYLEEIMDFDFFYEQLRDDIEYEINIL